MMVQNTLYNSLKNVYIHIHIYYIFVLKVHIILLAPSALLFGEDVLREMVRFWFRRFISSSECIEHQYRPEMFEELTSRRRFHEINFINNLDKLTPHKLSLGNQIFTLNVNGPFIDHIVTWKSELITTIPTILGDRFEAYGINPRKVLMTVYHTSCAILRIDILLKG